MEIESPDHLPIETIAKLLENWIAYPFSSDMVDLGQKFIASSGLCLKVASAIIPTEHNYLLNPFHDNFTKGGFRDARPFILDHGL